MEKEEHGEAGVITEKLVFSEALSVNNQEAREEWVIDSGCTYHMTSRLDWFSEFEENDISMILLGDNHTVESKGTGTIKIKAHGGSIRLLKNVRYVPNLRRNLISTGTLDKQGYKHEGGEGKLRFFKEGKTALQAKLDCGLYILDGHTIKNENCSAVTTERKADLWHCRLGHMSLSSMKILSGKGFIDDREVNNLTFCEHCVMGKSKRTSFNVGKHVTEERLGYVHADLWGSSNVTPSKSGKQYFLSIIDDKTRKVWIMFLKTKDETFDMFCEWKTLVENQINKKVKVLRTDNGLEFCNMKFDDYCKKNGIERQRTCTYTPQHNGVAERMNRTLMQKVRCLLSESDLDESFWAEAAAIAAYLVNRSPCSAIDHNVPEALWLDKKPGYKHLRRFYVMAYVHQDQGKLKPRALKGIFIGYIQRTKGYKIWLLEEEKVVISRNVVFNEQVVYKDLQEIKLQDQTDETDSVVQVETEVKTTENQEKGSSDAGVAPSGQGGAVTEIESDSESEEIDERYQVASIDLRNYQLARDRERRTPQVPAKFSEYTQFAFALITSEDIDIEEPKCFHEAEKCKDWKKWKHGMDEEMNSLWKNKTRI